ncbi:hypothetical protein HYV84_04330 [Candidatus Woesearchaeota archaeon]|nr:hypothetical protein [Candidatus Woesearchaeota archaeon]
MKAALRTQRKTGNMLPGPFSFSALLVLAVFFASPALAVNSSSVLLINLHYDRGEITYKDKLVKCGYAPDYRIQPGEGYVAELRGQKDELLYSFTFEVPTKVVAEISDPLFKKISGGIITLNTTDFVLQFPHFSDAKEVVVLNPRKFKVMGVSLQEEQFVPQRPAWWWLLLLLLLVIAACLVYRHLKKEE